MYVLPIDLPAGRSFEERNHIQSRHCRLSPRWKGAVCSVDTMPEIRAEVAMARIRHDAPEELVVACSWREGHLRIPGNDIGMARRRAEEAIWSWITAFEEGE